MSTPYERPGRDDAGPGPVDDPANDPQFETVGICHVCVHRRKAWPATCKAFPDGIPMEVFVGDVLHTKPYPGDKGIIFERVEYTS